MHHVRPDLLVRTRLASVDACTQREQGVTLTEYTSDADGDETEPWVVHGGGQPSVIAVGQCA